MPRMKRIRRRVSLSPSWWEGKTHVLIDMDGTLIGQPGALFRQLFLLGILLRMRSFGTPVQLVRATMNTIRRILVPHTFASNQEAFFEILSQELKSSRDKIESFLSRFFDADYPFVCLALHSDPNARHLIDLLHSSGRHITLATNPVFGRREIELRLKASDVYLHDFDLVTSWDVMTTTKPNLDFFSETLQKIGATPESTVMIGNDPYYDLPAHKVGIETLLVGPKLSLGDIANSLEEEVQLHQK